MGLPTEDSTQGGTNTETNSQYTGALPESYEDGETDYYGESSFTPEPTKSYAGALQKSYAPAPSRVFADPHSVQLNMDQAQSAVLAWTNAMRQMTSDSAQKRTRSITYTFHYMPGQSRPNTNTFTTQQITSLFGPEVDFGNEQHLDKLVLDEVHSTSPFSLRFDMSGLPDEVKKDSTSDGTRIVTHINPEQKSYGMNKTIYESPMVNTKHVLELTNSKVLEEAQTLVKDLPPNANGDKFVVVPADTHLASILMSDKNRNGLEAMTKQSMKRLTYAGISAIVAPAKTVDVVTDTFKKQKEKTLNMIKLQDHTASLARDNTVDEQGFDDHEKEPGVSKAQATAANKKQHLIKVKFYYTLTMNPTWKP